LEIEGRRDFSDYSSFLNLPTQLDTVLIRESMPRTKKLI